MISDLLLFLKKTPFIYLAALGLSCGTWNLLVVACELLVAACGIQFPDQGSNPDPCIGSMGFHPLDHQGSPSDLLLLQKDFDSLKTQIMVSTF